MAEGAKVTIPSVPLPEGTKTQLVLSTGSGAPRTFDIYLGRLPLVVEVDPKRGAIGERVVLRGRGFLPEPLQNAVTFAGQPALVLKASPTRAHRDRSASPAGRDPVRAADRRDGRAGARPRPTRASH